MKKFLSILLALMMFLPAALSEGTLPQLTHDQVKERMEANPYLNLIDIRNQDVYDEAHLPMALSMPLDSLKDKFQAILDGGFSHMETEIILYGDDAQDVLTGAEIVSALGFTNVSYTADIAVWPYKLIDTATEIAQAQRILGGMDAKDIYGNAVTEAVLSDYKLTMVNVWATYCNPCIQEMPELGKLSRDMKDQGVQIIGIVSDTLDYNMNRDEGNIALAKEIAESSQADYIHIVPDMVITQKLMPQITAVPTTFFLNQEGMLVGGVYMGSMNYDQWKEILDETLALLPGEEVAQ